MPLVFLSPPISVSTAHALAVFFACSYVGSLYISKNARLVFKNVSTKGLQNGQQRAKEDDERWRDDPDVIRARVVAACLSTVANCTVVLCVVWRRLKWQWNDLPTALETTVMRLGIDRAPTLAQNVVPCLITPVLFLGPLYGAWLAGTLPLQRNWSRHWNALPVFSTWQGLRNYIFGPLTEELVFRACTLAVYHMAGASRRKMIFLTPLLFGFAHVHHAWEIFNRYGRGKAAAKRALLATTVQLTYTSLFGFHTTFLFLRTGSLLAPLSAHIFCNFMGLPQPNVELARFPARRYAIRIAYLLGIVGYIWTLGRWSHVDECLYWPVEGAKLFY